MRLWVRSKREATSFDPGAGEAPLGQGEPGGSIGVKPVLIAFAVITLAVAGYIAWDAQRYGPGEDDAWGSSLRQVF